MSRVLVLLLPGWLCLAMWLGVQLAVTPCATAQTVHGAARVNTQVDACVPIDNEQFHRVLAIELGTSIEYSPSAAQQPDGTWVRVVCIDGLVQLQLDDNLTRKSMQRMVELPAVEIATRTRLLALSVAEFVVASWVELRLAQPPLAPSGPAVDEAAAREASQIASARLPAPEAQAAETKAPAPSDVPQASSSEQATAGPRWFLGISVEPVLFSGGSGLVPQLSLHLEQRPSTHFALGLALSLGRANWTVRWPAVEIGEALITTSSGRLTFAYLAALGPVELAIGAGARGGVVYMAGSTDRLNLWAQELYAPWGGPLLQLTAAGVAGSFRVRLELEGGYVTLPAEARIRESVIAAIRGFWGALGLGLGWLF